MILIYFCLYLDLRIIIVSDDYIIAGNFKSYIEFFYIPVIFAPEVEHSVEVTAVSYRNKTSKLVYCRALLSVTLLRMAKFDINYSNKDISVPSKRQYKIQLTSKIKKAIKRMRWKCLEFLGKLSSKLSQGNYGCKSLKYPPSVEQMADFELDLMNMIRNLESRKVNTVFQEQLNSDIKQIKKNKIFVSTGKSRNTYMLQHEEYTKLLKENVTKTYKKLTCKNYSTLTIPQKRSKNNCQSLIE